jgi:hypothetical protein
MKTIIIALLVTLSVMAVSQDRDRDYRWGRPTTKGIEKYVDANWFVFISDYQDFIKDTLFYEPFISTDDLSEYCRYSGAELGYFEYPDNVVVTNEPRYIDYELQRLNEFRRQEYRETNRFVRGVVMHELTHCYFYQQMMAVKQGDSLHNDFKQGLGMMPVDNFSTEFIEEGFCEFVTLDIGEMIGSDEKIVLTRNDLSQTRRNNYDVKYRYSRQFVSAIIKTYGLQQAIRLVVSHAAPSQEEILKPELYYQRLK